MTPLWLVFITIIIFAFLVILVKLSMGGFETFITNSVDLLYISRSFNNYIDSIHPNMYPIKINGCSKHISKLEFRKLYQSHIRDLPNSKKQLLKNYTNYIDSLLEPYHSIKNIRWKFAISKNGLEMNMPFTLADYIILPEDFINRIGSTVDQSIATTLLHEKIHILQRYNQEHFTKFYISSSNMPSIKVYYGEIPEKISMTHMNNPDSNGIYYVYRFGGISYLPLLVYNGTIVERGYNTIDFRENMDLYKLGLYYKKGLYHPNEMIAYSLSHSLINKKPVDLDLSNFIKSLI